MRKRLKNARPKQTPTELHSLTGQQAALLREAHEKPGGVYVPITGCPGADELVAGGAAEYREVRQTSTTTRSVTDPRPCHWSDLYLVPTLRGLELLGKAT